MSRFIQISDDTSVSVDRITRVQRLYGKTLIYLGDNESVLSDIPYETMLGILDNNVEIQEADTQLNESLLGGLQGIVENFGQPKP